MGTRTIYRCDVCERDFGADDGRGLMVASARVTYECKPPPDSEKPRDALANLLCCSPECLRGALETAVASLHEQASSFLLAHNCGTEIGLRVRVHGSTESA